jgi:stringent starvation protein B
VVNKRAYFESRLGKGSAFLHIDARRAGVRVPESFCQDPHLVLQYGYDLKIPIPDLVVNDWGVRATLSFSRALISTAVPWSAVYAVHGDDGEGFVWREDMPPDLERDAGPPGETVPVGKVAAPPPAKRRHLKLVD